MIIWVLNYFSRLRLKKFKKTYLVSIKMEVSLTFYGWHFCHAINVCWSNDQLIGNREI